MAKRTCRLVRDVDFAFLQPFDELVRRDVDNLDLCHLKDTIRNRFAYTDARERGNDVIKALDVLDIDRRINVDTRS